MLVQYWRDAKDLHTFARDPHRSHRAAQQRFLATLRRGRRGGRRLARTAPDLRTRVPLRQHAADGNRRAARRTTTGLDRERIGRLARRRTRRSGYWLRAGELKSHGAAPGGCAADSITWRHRRATARWETIPNWRWQGVSSDHGRIRAGTTAAERSRPVPGTRSCPIRARTSTQLTGPTEVRSPYRVETGSNPVSTRPTS